MIEWHLISFRQGDEYIELQVNCMVVCPSCGSFISFIMRESMKA